MQEPYFLAGRSGTLIVELIVYFLIFLKGLIVHLLMVFGEPILQLRCC